MTYAAPSTSPSFRVNGKIVALGDSTSTLVSRAGTPLQQYSYTIDSGHQTTLLVNDWVYVVDNTVYTVTLTEGKVSKITWERE